MKHATALFALVSIMAGSTIALTACNETSNPVAAMEDEHLTTLSFTVTGMSCQGCVSSVRNAIAKIDGVQSCEVSLEDESATVKVSDPELARNIVSAVSELEFTIEQSQ